MVGELLGLPLSEVREMPLEDFHAWIGWVSFKNEKEAKAVKMGGRPRRR